MMFLRVVLSSRIGKEQAVGDQYVEQLLSQFHSRTQTSSNAKKSHDKLLSQLGCQFMITIDGFDRFLDRRVGEYYDIKKQLTLQDLLISMLFAVKDQANTNAHKEWIQYKILYPIDRLPCNFRDYVKIEQHIQYISWSDSELYEFMCNRIGLCFNDTLAGKSGFNHITAWNRIFRGSLQPRRKRVTQPQQKIFEYLLRHTHSRPRDLLILPRTIMDVTRRDIPTDQEIEEGVRAGTLKLYRFFLNEYGAEYPFIQDFVQTFRNSDPIIIYDDQFYDKLRRGVDFARTRGFEQSDWIDTVNEDYMCALLCSVGFLGKLYEGQDVENPCRKIRNKRYRSVFEYELRDQKLNIEKGDRVCIHPMFYEALNIGELEGYVIGPISQCG